MSVHAYLNELEDVLSDLKSHYDDEVSDVKKQIAELDGEIEVLKEQNELLEEKVDDLFVENKYLESKIAQLEFELVEAVMKNKIA
jgi:peptidoglycan hydrolase CwlO-like protein